MSTVIVPGRARRPRGAGCERAPRTPREVSRDRSRRRCTAPRAECKVLATIVFVRRGRARAARRARVAVRASTPRCSRRWRSRRARRRALLAGRLADRGALRRLRRSCCRSSTAGPEVDVLGVGLSEEGLWTAWGIVAKATLAVLATGVLRLDDARAGDPARRRAAAACRASSSAIAGFALRYLQVVLDELRRMQLARVARGDDPRWLWQARDAARTVGALAVRHASSAASACTSRCSRAATTGACRRSASPTPPPPLAWAAALARPRSPPWPCSSPPGVGVSLLDRRRGTGTAPVAEPPALLVVGHGTRDADGIEEFWTLAGHVREAAGELPVGFGFIELAEPLVDAGHRRARGARAAATWSRCRSSCSPPGTSRTTARRRSRRARARHPGVAFRMGRDLGIDPVVLAVAEDRARAALGDADPAESAVVLVGTRLERPRRDLRPLQGRAPAGRRPRARARRARLRRRRPARACPTRSSAAAASGARHIAVVPFLLFTGVLRPAHLPPGGRVGGGSTRSSTCVGGPHLGPDRRLARLVLERYREALTGDVRMNCDLCTYRVRLPGYEDKVGTPISLTPHGDGPRARRPPLPPGDARARAAGRARGPRGRRCAPRRWSRCRRARRRRSTLEGLAYAYPDGSAALAGIDLRLAPASGSPSSARTAPGKTTLALAALRRARGRAGPGRGRGRRAGARRPGARSARRVGIVFQDADDQLFMPTVEDDVAFGPAKQGLRGRGAARARRRGARRGAAAPISAARAPHTAQRRRAPPRRDRRGARLPPGRARARRADRARSTPPRGASCSTCSSRCAIALLLVTHDLPYALELCPRAVVLDRGAGGRRRARRARCSPTRDSCARIASSCPPASTRSTA